MCAWFKNLISLACIALFVITLNALYNNSLQANDDIRALLPGVYLVENPSFERPPPQRKHWQGWARVSKIKDNMVMCWFSDEAPLPPPDDVERVITDPRMAELPPRRRARVEAFNDTIPFEMNLLGQSGAEVGSVTISPIGDGKLRVEITRDDSPNHKETETLIKYHPAWQIPGCPSELPPFRFSYFSDLANTIIPLFSVADTRNCEVCIRCTEPVNTDVNAAEVTYDQTKQTRWTSNAVCHNAPENGGNCRRLDLTEIRFKVLKPGTRADIRIECD